MSAVVVVIIVAVLIAVLALVTYLRHRQAERVVEEKRLEDEVGVHRSQADAKLDQARELGREASEHRELAEQHAELADQHAATAQEHAERALQLEDEAGGAGATAARHEAAAEERDGHRP